MRNCRWGAPGAHVDMVRAETFATFLDTAFPLLDQEHLKRFSYSGVAAASLVVTYKRNHVCMRGKSVHCFTTTGITGTHCPEESLLTGPYIVSRNNHSRMLTIPCRPKAQGKNQEMRSTEQDHAAYTHEQVSGASSTANKKNSI